MKEEVFTSDQTYFTTLGIAFLTGSEFSFKSLKPNQLPDGRLALDVYILREQEVLITKNYQDQDELRNMIFSGFSSLLHQTFGQTLVPSRQAYNQVLRPRSRLLPRRKAEQTANLETAKRRCTTPWHFEYRPLACIRPNIWNKRCRQRTVATNQENPDGRRTS